MPITVSITPRQVASGGVRAGRQQGVAAAKRGGHCHAFAEPRFPDVAVSDFGIVGRGAFGALAQVAFGKAADAVGVGEVGENQDVRFGRVINHGMPPVGLG